MHWPHCTDRSCPGCLPEFDIDRYLVPGWADGKTGIVPTLVPQDEALLVGKVEAWEVRPGESTVEALLRLGRIVKVKL